MEEKILLKIEELEKKTEQANASLEKIRRYFRWSLIITVAFFVLPLIGLLFAIPYFLNTFASIYGSL
jgi:uncharacterized membrane protein